MPKGSAAHVLAVMIMFGLASTAHARPSVDVAIDHPLTSRELVELPDLSGLAVSPDGKFAVVRVGRQNLTSNATELSWYRIGLDDGRAVRLGDAGIPGWNVNGALEPIAPQWSTDSAWVYYIRIEKEQAQVWRVKFDGSVHEQVTDFDADVQGFLVDGNDMLHVAVAGANRAEILAAEQKEYDRGVLMDSTVIPGFRPARNFPVNGRMATHRNLLSLDQNWGRSTLLGERPLRVLSGSLDERRFAPAAAAIEKRFTQWWEQRGFNPFDPNSSLGALNSEETRRAKIVRTPVDASKRMPRSRHTLHVEPVGTGTSVACEDSICLEADGLQLAGWTPRGREIIFQTSTWGSEALEAWNPDSKSVRTIFRSGGSLGSQFGGIGGPCRLASRRRGPDEAICLSSAADKTPRVVSINLKSGKARDLFDPAHRDIAERLGATEKVTLRDRTGATTYAHLILPKPWLALPPERRPRLPLVLTSYTCTGFLQGGSGQDVPEHILAGRGYAAMCVDLSGTAIRYPPGGGFRDYDQMLEFFEDAARVLVERKVADPKRIAVAGFSGSAAGVAYTLPRSNTFTAAIITTQSFIDPINCYLGGAHGGCRMVMKSKGFKPPYDRPDGYFGEISAAWKADKIFTPLLMQLPEVEYQANMQLHTAMADFGRVGEMYVFPDEYHSKHQPRHRLAVYDRNLAWIDFWLKGTELSDPDEAETMRRWRAHRQRQCDITKSFSKAPWYCSADRVARAHNSDLFD